MIEIFSITREHTVQIQEQHNPHQITSSYIQQQPNNQQRSIHHQIIQEAASTRFPVNEDISDYGFSSLANAPQFIRPFAVEYTVNEGEKAKLDAFMVCNPRAKVGFYYEKYN